MLLRMRALAEIVATEYADIPKSWLEETASSTDTVSKSYEYSKWSCHDLDTEDKFNQFFEVPLRHGVSRGLIQTQCSPLPFNFSEEVSAPLGVQLLNDAIPNTPRQQEKAPSLHEAESCINCSCCECHCKSCLCGGDPQGSSPSLQHSPSSTYDHPGSRWH
ncbi:hypothetical protein BJ165DRAFT_192436 [Panaeolus papilionaceus]|nr:hypothetical protein BJ165DRAFT_192436 [Panaeolus papilionaceus]